MGFGGFGLGGKPTNNPNKNPFGSVPSTSSTPSTSGGVYCLLLFSRKSLNLISAGCGRLALLHLNESPMHNFIFLEQAVLSLSLMMWLG